MARRMMKALVRQALRSYSQPSRNTASREPVISRRNQHTTQTRTATPRFAGGQEYQNEGGGNRRWLVSSQSLFATIQFALEPQLTCELPLLSMYTLTDRLGLDSVHLPAARGSCRGSRDSNDQAMTERFQRAKAEPQRLTRSASSVLQDGRAPRVALNQEA